MTVAAGWIDTHTHLYTEEFDEDREEVLARAAQAGVTHLFMPNIDDTTASRMLQLCETHKGCYPMMGLHPTSVDAHWRERLSVVRGWLEAEAARFVGIGEVGMDLYWDQTFRDAQMQVLDEQVQWALEYRLPLIVHCREAWPELLEVLAPYRDKGLTGIFHSYTGGWPAEQLLAYDGFMLGINGVVTFKKSTLPDDLKTVPLSRVVLETDSPYLAPVPHRGKRNESAYIGKVADRLAVLYGVPSEEVAIQTTANALKVFMKVSGSF